MQINRVLHRKAWASSSFHGSAPDSAFDGNTGSRWITQSFESQWVLTDLQKRFQIKKIIVTWRGNYATRYRVGISQDSVAWSLLWSNMAGVGGTETKDSLNGTGRYLKMYLDKRASADSGYVLGELEVYGIPPGSSAVGDAGGELPDRFALFQNYPNPFNPTSTITYQLPAMRHVRLAVFDLLGREVAVLVSQQKEPGSHTVEFDGGGLASGTYLYRMVAGSFQQTRKLIILR